MLRRECAAQRASRAFVVLCAAITRKPPFPGLPQTLRHALFTLDNLANVPLDLFLVQTLLSEVVAIGALCLMVAKWRRAHDGFTLAESEHKHRG